jgi:hypothetical protein
LFKPSLLGVRDVTATPPDPTPACTGWRRLHHGGKWQPVVTAESVEEGCRKLLALLMDELRSCDLYCGIADAHPADPLGFSHRKSSLP